MEKKLNRALYIIPAIYILLTAFFFYQHYSMRINFSQAIGNIELTGQSTKGTMVNPSIIKKLNIYVNGLSFRFNSNETLIIKTSDNIKHISKLLDYSSSENHFYLKFENDINLIFQTDFSDNKIAISAELPETVPPITELTLPFIEDRGFAIGYSEDDKTPVITNGETNFFIALTSEYSLDNENKNITIDVDDSSPITFMIQETLVGKGRTAEKWYEQNDADINFEYETAISNYVNSAFFGWNSRFNSKTGMWTDGDGVQQFNEITASSYLSESLLRGSYRTAASLIRTASVNLDDDLTALTATYLGNIVVKGKEFISSQNSVKNQITRLLNNQDREILKIDSLIDLMLTNKLEGRINEVITLALTPSEDESLSETVYRLNIINESYDFSINPDLDDIITELIENTILPTVNWLDEGLFLSIEDLIDIEVSFKAGHQLINYGKRFNNEFYTVVGKKMIISILDRAKESAFLPRNIFIEENRISSESGTLLPEDFYSDLTGNPYYIKQENLNETLGSGSWILTAAKSYNIQSNGRETTISVNFPKGSIHHFAIKGVKPFTQLYLRDIKWSSDPNFQRYSDGWVYDKVNETLYVKLTHRADIEKIRILYYYPETTVSETNTTTSSQ